MDYLYNMYGGSPYASKDTERQTTEPKGDNKTTSRIIGGMKAQGVTSKTVEVDGELLEIPNMEFVRMLERQLSEMRVEMRQNSARIARLTDNLNSARMTIKNLEDELRKNPVRFKNASFRKKQ